VLGYRRYHHDRAYASRRLRQGHARPAHGPDWKSDERVSSYNDWCEFMKSLTSSLSELA
jgi:hypothetical protein